MEIHSKDNYTYETDKSTVNIWSIFVNNLNCKTQSSMLKGLCSFEDMKIYI